MGAALAAQETQKAMRERVFGFEILPAPFVVAHLQLGRAYTIQGDMAKAKNAYQQFFTLWKDPDADLPVLKHARAEYAKL